MDMRNEMSRESECEMVFREMGEVYNANTSENFPVVFRSDSDFKAAMSILAICARITPGIRIYSFQIMSNHFHLVAGGRREDIIAFFGYYSGRLQKYFGDRSDFSEFALKLFPISDLEYLRNAIVYVNRNGFVVNDLVTPFSYPWGTSAYFFQPFASRYVEIAGKNLGNVAVRELMHSRNYDSFKDLKTIDGYVSPLEFCDIAMAERVFRNAKQYFYHISRKVETYCEVAKSIGESVCYTDNDIYYVAIKLSRERFGTDELRTLSSSSKIELAKVLHYDYNAGAKQLQRLLKLDGNVLAALF